MGDYLLGETVEVKLVVVSRIFLGTVVTVTVDAGESVIESRKNNAGSYYACSDSIGYHRFLHYHCSVCFVYVGPRCCCFCSCFDFGCGSDFVSGYDHPSFSFSSVGKRHETTRSKSRH